MRTILVTGADDFVGRHVAAHLASLPELTVRAGAPAGSASLPTGATLVPVVADLADARTLEAACDGVDVVVHCAAKEKDRAVTVNGTQAVLNAARAKGVRRVIHISSILVYGATKGVITEDTPLVAGFGDEVADAVLKAEAESLCRAAAAEGLSVVILRPAVIFGAGSPFLATLARRLANRVWGTIGKVGTGLTAFVDIKDVARAVALALEADVAPGSAFNISSPETVSWNALFAKFNDALGLPEIRDIQPDTLGVRVLTAGPAKLIARHIPALKPKVEHTLLSAPDFTELDQYRSQATYPSEKAAELLGWAAEVSLCDTMTGSAEWAKAEGLTRRTRP